MKDIVTKYRAVIEDCELLLGDNNNLKNMSYNDIDEICNSLRRKPKVHDSKAPYDGFDESDDTEENVKKGYLKM